MADANTTAQSQSSATLAQLLQQRLNAGAGVEELLKIAQDAGSLIDPAQTKVMVDYVASGGKGAQFLPSIGGELTPALPTPEEARPTATRATADVLQQYYANEAPGLDPETLRMFGAMPGEFSGPGGLLGAINYAALAPANLIRGGILEPLEAATSAVVTGAGQALANIPTGDNKTALDRLGDIFNPGVVATPQNLARDVLDFSNIASLYAGATPMPTVPRAPIAAEARAAPRIAEVAAEVTPPPAPRVRAPKVEPVVIAEDIAPAPIPKPIVAAAPDFAPTGPTIPVTQENVARAAKTLENMAAPVEDVAPIADKIGNINVSKLDATDDVKRLIDEVSQSNDAFIEARRGVMSIDEINNLADKVELEDIIGRRIGQPLNAEQTTAARRAVVASAEDLFNTAREYAATGDQNLRTKALEAVMRQAAFQEQLAGSTAELGRAMRALREVQGSDKSRAVEMAIGQFTDITDPAAIDDFLRKVGTLNSPEAISKFVGESVKPGFGDKITEFWINGLLAGPTTHAVNVTSNALFSALSIPEKALASVYGKVLRSPDRIASGEVGARIVGMVQGAKDGLRLFAQALRTGEAPSGVSAVERQRTSISGTKGKIVRIPSRFLTAEDELFKAINGRGELAAQAYQKAVAEAGKDTAKRAALYKQYLENPTKEMRAAADKQAAVMTFQNELGKWGKASQKFTRTVWPAQFIVPFLRTPINIIKQGLGRTPLAPLATSFWRDIRAGGRVRDEALARVTLGTAVAGSVVALAEAGQITGNGPSDPKQRAALLATGWQPQSIKIGDKYYQYGRLEPLALQLGLAADFATQSKYMGKEESDNAATAITLSIAKNLASKTYLQGISDLMEVFSDPDRYGERYLLRMASSFIPNVAGQTASSVDPILRDTVADTFAGQLINTAKAKMPGLSDNIPSRLDPWGDRITRTGFASPEESGVAGVAYNLLSPVRVSETDKSSPAKTEAARIMYLAGKPDKKVKIEGKSYDIPEDLHRRFAYTSGAIAKQGLDRIVKQPWYVGLDDETKRKVFRQAFDEARELYRDAVKYEILQRQQGAK